jgi:hypothetical protein
MTKTTRLLTGLMVAGMVVAGQRAAEAGTEEGTASRVRSSNPAITALVAEAAGQSSTFRSLVERVNGSDAIVYIEQGDCGRGVRACLTNVSPAGAGRMIWVRVDARKTGRDLMGSIGHELRHAVEVIDAAGVRTQGDMVFFYRQIGRSGTASGAVETDAAVEAGMAVRSELRKAGVR